MTFYVDGKIDNRKVTAVPDSYSGVRAIGARSTGDQVFNGSLDEVLILETMQVKTKRPVKLIDSLRKLRHNINYYRYTPTKAEAEDAVSLAHACFYALLHEVKKELEEYKR